jgi:hypothetical protein
MKKGTVQFEQSLSLFYYKNDAIPIKRVDASMANSMQ